MEKMNIEDYLKLICGLIQDFMGLDNKHIYIYNQKWIIPNDKKICVVVGCSNVKPIASCKEYKEENGAFKECFFVNNIAEITINIFSYDMEATNRKDEILMALNSDTAKNLQAQYGFSIGTLQLNFNQNDEKDGTKILNRFVLDFNLIYQSKKEVITSYYNDYNDIFLITNN